MKQEHIEALIELTNKFAGDKAIANPGAYAKNDEAIAAMSERLGLKPIQDLEETETLTSEPEKPAPSPGSGMKP